jgi:hypothetical protein
MRVTELWYALLENPAYRHVLLNHLPITGLALSACVLGWGLFEDRWAGVAFGLALVAATSLSAALVLQSGDQAYPFLFDQLDGDGQAWLDHHAFLAERFGRALPVNGLLAALAIGLGIRRIAWRRRLGVALLATSLACLAAAAIIAEAGGRIRHVELRTSRPPIHASAGRLR